MKLEWLNAKQAASSRTAWTTRSSTCEGGLVDMGGCWGLKEQQFEPLLKPLNDLSQATIVGGRGGWNIHALRLGTAVFFNICAIRKRGLRTSVPATFLEENQERTFVLVARVGLWRPGGRFIQQHPDNGSAKTSHYRKSGDFFEMHFFCNNSS